MCSLEAVMDACKEYMVDPDYVYKNTYGYIIVMKKLPTTITNEQRSNVDDADHAKFRASELLVVVIISINNINNRPTRILNRFYTSNSLCHFALYTVGEIVVCDEFDKNIDVVCSGGIHYFKTLDTAFVYSGAVPKNFTGCWTKWYDNGRKNIVTEYVKGVQSGLKTWWHENGKKETEGEYVNEKCSGIWTRWYNNGQKKFEGRYVDGKRFGEWAYWYPNGDTYNAKCI